MMYRARCHILQGMYYNAFQNSIEIQIVLIDEYSLVCVSIFDVT